MSMGETDEDIYDYLVKVESAQRAYKKNRVKAVAGEARGEKDRKRNMIRKATILRLTGITRESGPIYELMR